MNLPNHTLVLSHTAAKCLVYITAAAFMCSTFGLAHAVEDAYYRTTDGISIYLGVVPAEIVLGHPKNHPEAQMHDGAPDKADRYHVLVALFRSMTGTRIIDAQVTATVSPLGRAGIDKTLERMVVAGATTYGNYYAMPDPGPYRIEIRVRQRDVMREIRATFEYRKQDESPMKGETP